MHEAETRATARRAMEICNACRYCEGYCAVFPAMELRRTFTDGDLDYLANLCHDCRGCYYSCQYAPPHEFGVNLPRTFAELRQVTWVEHAWPRAGARLFARNGLVVALAAALGVALVLLLTMALQPADVLFGVHRAPGAFYVVIPMAAMVAVAGVTFGFALLAMLATVVRFWRATGSGGLPRGRPLLRALGDVLTLRNLGGGGQGCNDVDEGFSQTRRWLHHCLFYGFGLCFASTTVAAGYEHLLGLRAPYPFWSWPVVLGTLGGLGMVIGTIGLFALKLAGDAAPRAPRLLGADVALLALLGMTAATGLVLLALRATGAMGVLLAVHLGFVLALFLAMPYSRFMHGAFRAAALLRNAMEHEPTDAR
ncbi:MAG: tricarballylate utilization 4Fe-4S protein TcuB [Candidatus Lambdaproteobacteria bacterium]|nr:tricarballylate utilization 4Fe-4S protein TcuB [Candidatus Lambdaproteobacteria bacterium]